MKVLRFPHWSALLSLGIVLLHLSNGDQVVPPRGVSPPERRRLMGMMRMAMKKGSKAGYETEKKGRKTASRYTCCIRNQLLSCLIVSFGFLTTFLFFAVPDQTFFVGEPGLVFNPNGDAFQLYVDIQGTMQIGHGIANCVPAGEHVLHCPNTLDLTAYAKTPSYLFLPEFLDTTTSAGHGPVFGGGGVTGTFEALPTSVGNYRLDLYFD